MSTLIGEMLELLGQKPDHVLSMGLSKKEQRQFGSHIREDLLKCRRFHFSSKAARAASTLVFNAKDAGSIMSLARPPFNDTWLEWNLVDQIEAVNQFPASDAPHRIGVVVRNIDDKVLITLVIPMVLRSRVVTISPVSLLFDPVKPLDKLMLRNHRALISACTERVAKIRPPGWKAADIDPEQLMMLMDTIMVGGRANPDGSPETRQQQMLIDHSSWIFTPYFAEAFTRFLVDKKNPEPQAAAIAIVGERIVESAGLLRFVIGALALLNSQTFVTRTAVKPTDKKQPEAYRPHKKSPVYEFVEFTAPHKVYVNHLIEEASEPGPKKAQHEVAAHFAHSRKIGDPTCDHDYEYRGGNSWICLSCGNKRWRRKTHLRGDPNLGVIIHKDRVVIT